ncbi:MAG TPA: type VI secretion system tip protein TssI/VgrG [Blastocatellia bacterium]|nr:type VI secretion system tip protein TssI/VgrG [Blastocatellia bacterium]
MPTYTQDNRFIRIDTPLGVDELLLQRFNGEEGVSKLFHFDLTMHSENRSIQFDSIVGKKATVTVFLPDGSKRHINGIINSFSQGGSSPLEGGTTPTIFTSYYATLVPWLWTLTRTSDCRIFQNMSAPDIIAKVFKEHGFSDFAIRLYGAFEPREYCVQYRETDFNFVSRLMEEEGIFYFFEHSQDKHILVLANRPKEFKPSPLHPDVSYKSVIGEKRERDVISEWSLSQEVRPDQYTLKDFNFQQPTLDLTSTVKGKDERKLEIYDYPGEYREKGQGERLVGLRMEEEQAPLIVISGSGTCVGFTPGYRFDLRDHYRRDFNKSYVLTSVYHEAVQGGAYRSSSDGAGAEFHYANHFQCVPHPTAFRPPRVTPAPVVHGSQTAIVVGPAGEEIYVDKYSRVKAQFHWDREGKRNENSSCWIRVSQNWAGKRWGAIFIPRIGQEVIVDFLEGDPDQPIITGRVYNGDSMPPYELPGKMVVSGVKTDTHKGQGYNELSMDDTAGNEQITIHAQYDMGTTVEHDDTQTVHNDRTITVDGAHTETIKKDTTITVTEGKETNTVRQQIVITSETAHIHVTAATEIKLEVGASTLLMKSDGSIKLKGVNIAIDGSESVNTHGASVTTKADMDHNTKGAIVVSEGTATNTVRGGMVMLNP